MKKIYPFFKRTKKWLPFVSANRITAIRIIPAWFAFYYVLSGQFMNSYAAFGFYLTAALLDFADGEWARANDEVSLFGKFFDPFVDKIIVMAMLGLFASIGCISKALFFLILMSEFYSTIVYTRTAFSGIIKGANYYGKAKKIIQDSVVLTMLIWPPIENINLEITYNTMLFAGCFLSLAGSFARKKCLVN
jgi:phosphatidylglycerophosphate synthase